MTPRELAVGEIVQIDPALDRDGKQWFGGCLMVVTESKSWGAQGYVQSAGVDGQQFYRCQFEHMEPTGGTAPWQVERQDEPT
jgi:hypothetical protein